MRARNLKPGLFKNEILGSADPLLTILFEGLWCMADREGRLEDRPLRICAAVFPYRRSVTEKKADNMLRWLHEQGFVTRYEVAGKRYIQVLEFLTHQNPHKNEAHSKIPALTYVSHGASTGQAPEHSDTSTGQAQKSPGLFSDSLTPDSLTPLSERANPPNSAGRTKANSEGTEGNGSDLPRWDDLAQQVVERGLEIYPQKAGRVNWITAAKYIANRLQEGATVQELIDAMERYRAYVDDAVKDRRYVLDPATFFSAEDKPWTQAWTPPESQAEQRLNSNLEAAAEAKRRLIAGGFK